MFISCNAETDCFLFPVIPEKITFSDTIKNTSVRIASLGETTIIEKPGADIISFNSRFPAVRDQAVVVENLYEPKYYRDKLEEWRRLEKPVHFVCTSALNINQYFTIEDISYTEQGGPVGEISFAIKLKVYNAPKIRKIVVQQNSATAIIVQENQRVDNRIQADTYTVVSGDTLYKIAKAQLGDGSRWREIYELNKDKITDPNKIYPAQVFKLPERKE
jgi:nucleoid-associated protein YgaU